MGHKLRTIAILLAEMAEEKGYTEQARKQYRGYANGAMHTSYAIARVFELLHNDLLQGEVGQELGQVLRNDLTKNKRSYGND